MLVIEQSKEGEGIREFIRVLRLLEDYPLDKVRQAMEKALYVGAHSRDAIMQFLIPHLSWRNTTFLLDRFEHLRLVQVSSTDISAYRELLSCGGEA
jgi:hypothetical protein